MDKLSWIDLRGDRSDPSGRLPRASETIVAEARSRVREILDAVRREGDGAVARYTAELDGYDGSRGWSVPLEEAEEALDALDPRLRDALAQAADRVRWFHERARPRDWLQEVDGALLGVRHQPLQRVGVYVPGGLGAYPSTVVMTLVPAQVAEVDEVVLCTPPGPDGEVNQTILAAVALVGADRIFRIGGAQAVAAMAYGTETVPRCDKIVGPGNAYVAEAKAQVSGEGVCGIDTLAGVTEVAIIADGAADPTHVAADLVAQAEHDPLATALLITPDEGFGGRVETALAEEVANTRHADRVQEALSGQGAIILVDDLDHAVAVANAFAAEHLEVQCEDAVGVAENVRRAGAIFVGGSTPVSLGDYAAGPNHTLPTGGAARFRGGLSTSDFLVPVNWVQYSAEGLAQLAPVVDALAEAENLPAHARAVRVRTDDAGDGS
jgi:histidinol dehydrogenase